MEYEELKLVFTNEIRKDVVKLLEHTIVRVKNKSTTTTNYQYRSAGKNKAPLFELNIAITLPVPDIKA